MIANLASLGMQVTSELGYSDARCDFNLPASSTVAELKRIRTLLDSAYCFTGRHLWILAICMTRGASRRGNNLLRVGAHYFRACTPPSVAQDRGRRLMRWIPEYPRLLFGTLSDESL